MSRSDGQLKRDLLWGIQGGTIIATVFIAWVVVLYALQGSGPFDRQGVSLVQVVTAYLAIGAVAGTIIGAMRPWTTRPIGAYMTGAIAGLPVAGGIAVCARGLPMSWDSTDWIAIPILAAVAACVIGSELRKNKRAV